MSNSKGEFFKNDNNKFNEQQDQIISNFYVSLKKELICPISKESIYKKIEPTPDMDTYAKRDVYCKRADINLQESLKRCNILNTINHLKIR